MHACNDVHVWQSAGSLEAAADDPAAGPQATTLTGGDMQPVALEQPRSCGKVRTASGKRRLLVVSHPAVVNVNQEVYRELVRRADAAWAPDKLRAKPPWVKEQIVRERGYRNLCLAREDLAEFEHWPKRAERSYRIVVLRKTIVEERGQLCLGQSYRYFFYITNDRTMTREQVVREANHRCNQENLHAQLKGGVRALRAPLNTLHANWAYMAIVAIAWSLKVWFALLLPVAPRWRTQQEADRERVLRMEFRSFVQRFILVPAQIVRTGRQLIYRLLAWRPELPIFFRLLDGL